MEINYLNKEFAVKGIEIIAEENGEKIGNAILYLLHNPNRDKNYGLLADVMVDPQHRSGGIGSKIVERVIEVAKEEKCYKLLADSRFSREKVHAWYEKFGFVKHGFGFRMDLENVEPQD